jgi:hypothetical protein
MNPDKANPFDIHILPGIDKDKDFQVGQGGQLVVESLARKTWTELL